MMDANLLKKGEDFDKLPETWVIFITENDVIGKGLPLGTCFLDSRPMVFTMLSVLLSVFSLRQVEVLRIPQFFQVLKSHLPTFSLRNCFLNDKCAAGWGQFLTNVLNRLEISFDSLNVEELKEPEKKLSSICAGLFNQIHRKFIFQSKK